jgi:hypothetical protein
MSTKTKEQVLDLPNYEAHANMGYEDVTAEDMKIPFLTILQALSPQVQKKMDKYVEGAEAGMIFETVSGKVYNEITVIPCGFRKAYVEWVPRNQGGGYVKAHPDSNVLNLCHKDEGSNLDILPNGNSISTTAYHSVMLVEDGCVKPCMISMTGTQLKHSRSWITLMTSLKMPSLNGATFMPPMYAYYWKLRTVQETNKKGSFYSWSFEQGKQVTSKELFNEAKALHISVTKNQLALANAPHQEEIVEVM